MALFVSSVFACVSFVILACAVKLMKIYHFSVMLWDEKNKTFPLAYTWSALSIRKFMYDAVFEYPEKASNKTP